MGAAEIYWRQKVDEMHETTYIPLTWFCPSCGYELVKRTGENQTTPNPVYKDTCPDDGTKLERMTWKRKAEQLLRTIPDANCMVAINELRRSEGASVEIFCDNPDGPCAIEVTDDWTSWSPRRFEGVNVLEALYAAQSAKRDVHLLKRKNVHSQFGDVCRSWNWRKGAKGWEVCVGDHERAADCVWRPATTDEAAYKNAMLGGSEPSRERCTSESEDMALSPFPVCEHEYFYFGTGRGRRCIKCGRDE